MKQTIKFILALLFLIWFGCSIGTGDLLAQEYSNTSGQRKEGTVQKRPGEQKMKRFFVEGMVGGGFSSYSSYLEVAPIIGYRITKNFHVAARIPFIYNEREYEVFINGVKYCRTRAYLSHYGASFYGRYIIFKGIFAQAEYEILSLNTFGVDDNGKPSPNCIDPVYGREMIGSLFLGGGYIQQIGNAGFTSIAILFNVLDNPGSPYGTYLIRIGFGGFF